MSYFAFHAAGLGSIVAECLRSDLNDVDILEADGSGLHFKSSSPATLVGALPYLRNTFEVLTTAPRREIGSTISDLAARVRKIPRGNRSNMAFRVMAQIDGELLSITTESRRRLEQAITTTIGGRVEPRGSGTEYWVIGRRDLDIVFLGRRLKKDAQPKPARGELASELAHLIVRISQPRSDDIVLDPFAGSGALLVARSGLPYARLIYSDLELAQHRGRLGPLRSLRAVQLLADDALTLPHVKDRSVTSIITDPPWGEHTDVSGDYADFAIAMFTSFERVLSPANGRVAVLTGRQITGATLRAAEEQGFAILATHDILVNGHPATVVVARPRSRID